MVYCKECGQEDRNGSAYCIRCGAMLSNDTAGAKVIPEPSLDGGMPYGAPRPAGSRKGLLIAVIAVVLVCAVVAAVFLVTIDEKKPPADGLGSERGIHNGSWAEYQVSVSGKNLFTYGTCRVTYSNVTEHSYVMTMTMTVNGETATETTTIFQKGNVWAPETSCIPGVSMTVIGNETTSTHIGIKNTTHVRFVTPEYVEDDWYHSSGCLVGADISYNDGTRLVMTLVGTNIECIWD